MIHRDQSGPRDPYFLRIQTALKNAGIHQPSLVVDHDRLAENITQLNDDITGNQNLRIVAKSLPSIPLLKAVSKGTGSHRFMTFNAPMLTDIADAFPNADQLLGKPFPLKAAAQFYADHPNPNGRIGWLIDTNARLDAYAQLGGSLNRPLDISLELDVGLHRGGFSVGDELTQALKTIHASDHLTLHGMMGYDAHIAKTPKLFGMQQSALNKSWRIYSQALDQARAVFGADHVKSMVRNAGGSPTFKHYQSNEIANEVSVGSALMRPTDFDIPTLENYRPALFIAAPALKVAGPMQTPVLERLDRFKNALDPNLATRIFLHGGYWKARPIDPPGLRTNATYGRSSNQELLTGGPNTQIDPDDFVFLRPTQSEAIMLQFGEIAVFQNDAITDFWAPLSNAA